MDRSFLIKRILILKTKKREYILNHFIDILGIVDTITYKDMLNSVELFNLKGVLYNFTCKSLSLDFAPSLIT